MLMALLAWDTQQELMKSSQISPMEGGGNTKHGTTINIKDDFVERFSDIYYKKSIKYYQSSFFATNHNKISFPLFQWKKLNFKALLNNFVASEMQQASFRHIDISVSNWKTLKRNFVVVKIPIQVKNENIMFDWRIELK